LADSTVTASGKTPASNMQPTWVHRLVGPPGVALAFFWGLAEGSFFFVVPDVAISLVAMLKPRWAWGHVMGAVAGTVAAAMLLFFLVVARPRGCARYGCESAVRDRQHVSRSGCKLSRPWTCRSLSRTGVGNSIQDLRRRGARIPCRHDISGLHRSGTCGKISSGVDRVCDHRQCAPAQARMERFSTCRFARSFLGYFLPVLLELDRVSMSSPHAAEGKYAQRL